MQVRHANRDLTHGRMRERAGLAASARAGMEMPGGVWTPDAVWPVSSRPCAPPGLIKGGKAGNGGAGIDGAGGAGKSMAGGRPSAHEGGLVRGTTCSVQELGAAGASVIVIDTLPALLGLFCRKSGDNTASL